MRKARIIMTLDCSRHCSYCCNKQPGLLDQGKMLEPEMTELKGYDEAMVTGGEPMLYPWEAANLASILRDDLKIPKIYLYSALYRPELWEIIGAFDGMHFTLHENASDSDVYQIELLEHLISKNLDKSFRLYINPAVGHKVTISPHLWKRVEVKGFLNPCPLPKDEELFFTWNARNQQWRR
jgi:pyruvate-formate lyase-activating enzyme